MIFRDGLRTQFPRKSCSQKYIECARQYDKEQKEKSQLRVNSSKYRKVSDLKIGDAVLIRNHTRNSKFQPLFGPEPYTIVSITDEGNKLTVERCSDGGTLIRHPDESMSKTAEEEMLLSSNYDNDYENNVEFEGDQDFPKDNDGIAIEATTEPRRSSRDRRPNVRFCNDECICHP